MARPPKDPSPVASTGGTANAQGQSIFTGDWNSLVDDYLSQTDTSNQSLQSQLFIRPTTDVPPLIVRGQGIGSGTADLQQWQVASDGTVLVAIDKVGNINFLTGNSLSFTTSGLQVKLDSTGLFLKRSADAQQRIKIHNDAATIDLDDGTHVVPDTQLLRTSQGVVMVTNNVSPNFQPAGFDFFGDIELKILEQNSDIGVYNASNVLLRSFLHDSTVHLVNADETQASATVPNADTTLKTFTLAANTYTQIIVEAEGYVQESALTANQNISIKVKLAGTQAGQTMLFNPQAVTVGAKTPFPIKASGALQAGGAVTVTIGAPAADANTTVFLNSLRVYGVRG